MKSFDYLDLYFLLWDVVWGKRPCSKIKDYLRLLSIHYTSDRKKGYFGYYNSERQCNVVIKVGRFYRKFFPTFTDAQIENLVYHTLSRLWPDDEVKVVTGQDIVDIYCRIDISGNCMKGKRHIVSFYAQQDKVELAYLLDANGDGARCIIWTLPDGRTYADRIFGNCGVKKSALREWVRENCDLWRTHSGYPDPDCDSIIDNSEQEEICLQYTDTGVYPYLDSFCFVDTSARHLFNYADSDCDAYAISTDGTLECKSCCECCRDYGYGISYLSGVGNICQHCRDEYYTMCEHCNEWASIDDVVYMEYSCVSVCESCASAYYTYCGHCEQLVLDDDIVDIDTPESSDVHICRDCLREDYVECDCANYELKEKAYTDKNGAVFCTECFDRELTRCECGRVFEKNGYTECEDCACDFMYSQNTI